MSNSYSVSETVTFNVTHARHMAAKVATDLKRIQRYYSGGPSDENIASYEAELTELLRVGCVEKVSYGFRRNGNWIEPSVHYSAQELGDSTANDDDPGKIKPGADITDASFWSYLTYSSKWSNLSTGEKETILSNLPFKRGTAPEPGVDGVLISDVTYSAGGRSLKRSNVRSSQ